MTAIVYLNPGWSDVPTRGGELRLWTAPEDKVDIAADGGVFVIFWSDQLPHEVLPCFEPTRHRYALTQWLVSEGSRRSATTSTPSRRRDTRTSPDSPIKEAPWPSWASGPS